MIRSGVNEDNELVNSETKNTSVDIGFAKPFGGTVIPPGYLYCDGSEVSRQAYDKLFAAIGTTWGEGDGENTFNLPDLRGIFVRCVEAGTDVKAGQKIGEIWDYFGNPVAQVHVPADGRILYLTSSIAVEKDGFLLDMVH